VCWEEGGKGSEKRGRGVSGCADEYWQRDQATEMK
jgi:hypothetical protein